MIVFDSIPGVVEVTKVGTAEPELLIEVPHGATRTADYAAIESKLESPLPHALVDFFHVNTDAGAPELGQAIARLLGRPAVIYRCLIPRTFIDCNRRIDATAAELREGKVTPGLMPWITSPRDREMLRDRYDAYVGAVNAAAERVLPRGLMLLLHTYAPRTVDVEVNADIVTSLHRAYQPDVVSTWPLRPPVDVIHKDLEGNSHAPPRALEVLRSSLRTLGIEAGDSATYPLHPSTLAWSYVTRWPGRALCIEVRRDLVADPFVPFEQMKISASAAEKISRPIADALNAAF